MCYGKKHLAKTVKFRVEAFSQNFFKKIICVENKQKTHDFSFQPQKAAILLFI